MTQSEEIRDLMKLAEVPVQFLRNSGKIKNANAASWAVDEIRRLRAKVNKLIRVENAEDADGNYVAQPNAQAEDLILEEEI
jgi:hypothetical protein